MLLSRAAGEHSRPCMAGQVWGHYCENASSVAADATHHTFWARSTGLILHISKIPVMALLCFLPPMSLEGSLPKGSGAFTHLPLKKVRAPFRGLRPTTALVCCSGLCCSPVGREQ